MRFIVLGLMLIAVSLNCAAGASALKPGSASLDVKFNGVKQEKDRLYVCAILRNDSTLDCVDYLFFQKQLEEQPGAGNVMQKYLEGKQ
jgi:hypothetical protein